jgi:hypothetical protein
LFYLTYGYFVYFVVIWYIYPHLVCFTMKIWQPWSVNTSLYKCHVSTANSRHFFDS